MKIRFFNIFTIGLLVALTACSGGGGGSNSSESTSTPAVDAKALLTRSVEIQSGNTTNAFVTAACGTRGGIAVYSGIDLNNDGNLSISEQNPTPQVVCNGVNGFTSVVDTVALNVGDANCPQGGVTVNFGLDLNTNGTLDIATELTQSINLCNAADGVSAATDTVFSELGSLKGSVPTAGFPTLSPSRGIQRATSNISGGLWLTPSSIEAAIAEDKKAKATADSTTVPEPVVEPIAVPVASDGTYEVTNLPSNNDYALVYINSAGKSKKVESITVTPGSVTVKNIVTADLSDPGSMTLEVKNLSGNPLAGATVRLNELDKNITTTLGDSIARFDRLAVGTYSVTVSHPDYVSQYKVFHVDTNATTDLGVIQLNSEKGRLAGRVSASDVDDYSNIIVYAKGVDGSVYTTFTSASGNYIFNALPVGSAYSVIAYAHDYQSEKADGINISKDYTTTVDTINLTKYPTFYLTADANGTINVGSISGYARFSDVNESLNHAGIIVSLEGTDYEAITSRDGSFILNNIPEGNYTLNFTDSTHNSVTKTTRVVVGATSHILDVELLANKGTVSGITSAHGSTVTVQNSLHTYQVTSSLVDGTFTITDVVVGEYTVVSAKDGYGSTSSTLQVLNQQTVNIGTQTLTQYQLNGVVDLEGTADESAATIRVVGTNISASSSNDGSFTLYGLTPGTYQIQVTKSGYISSDLYLVTVTDTTTTMPTTITLAQAKGSLSGVVNLDGNSDNSGVIVTVGATGLSTVTNVYGQYSINMPTGTYADTITFTHVNYVDNPHTAPFDINASQTTQLAQVTLASKTQSITGIVKDADGALLSGASIVTNDGVSTTTSADGTFTLSNVKIGSKSISATLTGYGSASTTVDLNASSSADAGVLVLSAYRLNGVIDLAGTTDEAGATISVVGTNKSTISDTNGTYSITGVTPGTYQIQVTKSGYISSDLYLVTVANTTTTMPTTITLAQAKGSLSGVVNLDGTSDNSGVLVTVVGIGSVSTNSIGQWSMDLPVSTYSNSIQYTKTNYQTYTDTNDFNISASKTTQKDTVNMDLNLGTITGKVVDDVNATLAGVSVAIISGANSYSVDTNATGGFSLNVAVGSYTVSAMKSGYGFAQKTDVNITFNTQNSTLYTTPMQLLSNTITGTINVEGLVDNKTGVTVTLTNLSDSSTKSGVISGTNGSFTISAVKNGNYKLEITHVNADYKTTTLELYNINDDGYIFATPIDVAKKSIAKDFDMLTFDYIRGQNVSTTAIKYNLILPTVMPNGSSVSWASDNTALISNSGAVTLPLSTAVNTLNLSATVSYSGEADKTKTLPLTVLKEYQPYMSASGTTSALEDFGYLVKDVTAINLNGEAITYSITNESNLSLVDSLSIDSVTGQISVKSKENMNGFLTFDVVASSGTPALTATKHLTLVIDPVDDMPTADAGSDIISTPGAVTLNANNSVVIDTSTTYSWKIAGTEVATSLSPTITLNTVGDYVADLNITSGSKSSADSVNIHIYPSLSISDKTVDESDNKVVFRLNLSAVSTSNITMNVQTQDATALQYKDYSPIDTEVTIPAGVSYVDVEVPVIVDQQPEASEYFYIKISNANGVIVNDDTAQCNINYKALNLANLTGDNGFRISDTTGSNYETLYNGYSYSYFPKNISSLGDWNNDGYDDFTFGLYKNSTPGKTYTINGKKVLSSDGEFDLTDVSLVTATNGENNGDSFGSSVGGVGDFNGDGYNDMIVGAPDFNASQGKAYIYLSSSTTIGDVVIPIVGYEAGSKTGYSVDFAGDVNGDGYDDIIVGTGYADGSLKGYAFIIYGKSGIDATPINTNNLGAAGIVISTTTAQNESAGTSVSKAGDVNGDGYDDVIIAAPQAQGVNDDNTTASLGGRVFVVYGKSTLADISLDSFAASDGVVYKGTTYSSGSTPEYGKPYLGYEVTDAGDVNGDGLDDVMITTGTFTSTSFGVYLIYGSKTLTDMNLQYDGSPNYNAMFANNEGLFLQFKRWSRYLKADKIGDFNGDGYDDILIGSASSSVNSLANVGKAYVIYGGATLGTNGKFTVESSATNYLDGQNGFTIEGLANADLTGYSVSGVGDVNGDGYKDIAVVAPNTDTTSNLEVGSVYVIYGGGFNVANLLQGAQGEDTITGTSGDDVIVSGASSDTVYSNGGKDSISTGEGGDLIYIEDADFISIDGGNGFDILKLDAQGLDVNLSALASKIKNIEVLDISGNGPNNIIFDKASALKLVNPVQLRFLVIGDYDDKIIIDDADNTWQFDTKLTSAAFGSLFPSLYTSFTPYIDEYVNKYIIPGTDAVFYIEGRIPKLPTVSISNVEVLEDDGVASVKISRDISSYTSTFSVSTTDGTALAGSDYSTYNSSVTMYYGEKSKIIEIPLSIDNKLEAAKTFDVNISDNKSTFLGVSNATVTINDNAKKPYKTDREGRIKISGKNATYSGYNVSSAGDVNNDGYNDFLMGSYYGSDNDAYLLFGRADINLSNITLPANHTAFSVGVGVTLNALINTAVVSPAGDFNDDNISDIMVADFENDKVYVIFGSATIGDSGILDVTPANTLEIVGAAASDTGFSLDSIGDFNSDGIDDIIIGAPNEDKAYIIYGKTTYTAGSTITLASLGVDGVVLSGGAGGKLGYSVSGVGDFDNDAKSDVIVGAYLETHDALANAGAGYIVYGGNANSTIDVVNDANVTKLYGNTAGERVGYIVSGIGNFNDMLSSVNKDVVITSGKLNASNKLYLVTGNNDRNATQTVSSSLTIGRSDIGPYKPKLRIGTPGDFNKDGYDDILIPYPDYNTKKGRTYIHFGNPSATLLGTVSGNADGVNLGYFEGENQGDYLGITASFLGDINNDGNVDMIIGAPFIDSASTGSAFIMFGY